MIGDRTNYGNRDDGKRITLRLYGDNLREVEALAASFRISTADAVVLMIERQRKKKIA